MAARSQSLPGSSRRKRLLAVLCAVAFPDFAGAPITNDALPRIRVACPPGRTQVTFAADAAGSLTAHGHDISLRRINARASPRPDQPQAQRRALTPPKAASDGRGSCNAALAAATTTPSV